MEETKNSMAVLAFLGECRFDVRASDRLFPFSWRKGRGLLSRAAKRIELCKVVV